MKIVINKNSILNLVTLIGFVCAAIARFLPVLYFIAICFVIVIIINPKKIYFEVFLTWIFLLDSIISSLIILAFFLSIFLRRHEKIKIDGITKTLVILIILKLVSVVFAANKYNSIYYSLVWCVFLLLFFCMRSSIWDKDDSRLITSLSSGGCILSLFCVVRLVNFPMFSYINTVKGMAVSSSNVPAIILIVLFIWMTCPKQLSYGQGAVKLTLFKEIIIAIGVISTGSRAGILVLCLWVVFLTLINTKSTSIKKIFSCICLIGGVCYFLLVNTHTQFSISELLTVTDMTNYSNAVRISIYKDVLFNILPDNLIWGVGTGNFVNTYHLYSSVSFVPAHTHDIYLQVLVENGIVGGLIFIILLGLAFKKLLSIRKSSKIIFFTYFSIYFIMLCFGVFENIFVTSGSAYMFVIILARISAFERSEH